MAKVTISLCQMDVKLGNPRANWDKMQKMTAQAKQQGAQVVIFPELWDAGFDLEKAGEYASTLSGGLFAEVINLSKQQGMYIFGSMLEKRGNGVSNALPIIAPNGMMGVYRKIHLFSLMNEDRYLAAGQAPVNVQFPWGLTGFAICYDLRFPELFRRYAVEGAKLVVVPSQWPNPRMEAFRTLLRARAIENGVFMAVVNRVGEDVLEPATHDNPAKTATFFGHSTIVDPWGNIIFEAGSQEGVYTATLDLDEADKARKHISTLADRRPEIYGNF